MRKKERERDKQTRQTDTQTHTQITNLHTYRHRDSLTDYQTYIPTDTEFSSALL